MSIVNEYALKSLTNELVQASDIPITSHRGYNLDSIFQSIERECNEIAPSHTNKIEEAIIEIANLKNRVDALEQVYDSHFIETQYKLSLLGMDYELETEGIR